MLTIKQAQLKFNQQGIPFSLDYQDTYYSVFGPVEESNHVFIQGNQIADRWQSKYFTIAEIGFGLGVNFLTTCHKWLAANNQPHPLHYISFEKHPVRKADLYQCYKNLGLESGLSSLLLARYPLPVSGFHRIHFNQQNIVLTLIYGDALELLQESTFQADCWYLDGFSPDKNQELWTQAIAHQIFRLTREGGTFSTYSAASQVRKNFQHAGFSVVKQQGFRNKREMLSGLCENKTHKEEFNYKEKCWFNLSENSTSGRHTTIIGAGLAGVCIAAALAKRNWKVTLIDKHARSAMEGSGNKNAILMPRLSVDHDAQSQLTLSGYLYSLNFFNHLKQMAPDLTWEQCGAIQIPRDEKQCQRMKQLLDQQDMPDDLLHPVTKNQINALSGCSPANEGWHIPLAGWTIPEEICDTLLNLYKDNIEFIADTEISSIHETGTFWAVLDHYKKEASRSSSLVIANATSANQFNQTQWCKTSPKRGQVTYLPKASSTIHPQKIICADAYITPEVDSQYVLGASFITADTSQEIRQSEHLDNLAKIRHMIPDFEYARPDALDGRAAIRAVSPDRLPIVGPVARADKFYSQYTEAALGATHKKYHNPDYYNGLYLATGFGSRGLAWIPLCAEVIACMIADEPLPLGKSLINSLHPSRYLMNNLIKQVS